jgi:DNA repair exonuclease SbcCD nuclease subunit
MTCPRRRHLGRNRFNSQVPYWSVEARTGVRGRETGVRLREFTKEYRGLKLRSRITEAVRVEVGSDDREVCKKFLREKNLEVLRRRDELDKKFVELETEWTGLQETYWSIQVEQEDEIAARIRWLGL